MLDAARVADARDPRRLDAVDERHGQRARDRGAAAARARLRQVAGKLRGKIVLVSEPAEGSEPDQAPFRRQTDEELRQARHLRAAHALGDRDRARLKRTAFAAKVDAFLASEGAVAWLRQSYRDGGLLHGEGYAYRVGQTPRCPASSSRPRTIAGSRGSRRPTPCRRVELTSAVRYRRRRSQRVQHHRRDSGPRREGRLRDGRRAPR